MATYSNSQAHKLIACTQTLFYLSFPLRRRSINTLRVLFFYYARSTDFEEKREGLGTG